MLTSKQRAYLRGIANGIDSIFQVGKGGIGENLITQLSDALEKRELIKITVLDTAFTEVREVCDTCAELTGSEAVACIGSKFILYKRARNAKNQKIELPSNRKKKKTVSR